MPAFHQPVRTTSINTIILTYIRTITSKITSKDTHKSFTITDKRINVHRKNDSKKLCQTYHLPYNSNHAMSTILFLLLLLSTSTSSTSDTSRVVSSTPASTTPAPDEALLRYRTAGDPLDDQTVVLGVILPLHLNVAWNYNLTGKAIALAVESVNRDRPLYRRHMLSVEFGDSKCSDITAPLKAIDMYLQRRVKAFVGPVCEYALAPIARYSPHWNMPVLTAGGFANALSNKTGDYRQLTRAGGSYDSLGHFVDTVFERFNWTHLSLVYYNTRVRGIRSDCYFVMEALYLAIKQINKRRGASGNGGRIYTYFHKAFSDENRDNITRHVLRTSRG